MWFIGSGAGLAVSAALIVLGLHGRRVDSAPRCRSCGYNLTGLGSSRCPECGGSTDNPLRGSRLRRPGLLRFGYGLLAISVVLGAGAGLVRSGVVAPIRYAPLTWLLNDMEDGSEGAANAAASEILRRLEGGTPAQADIRRIARRCLAIQAATAPPRYSLDSGLEVLGHMEQTGLLTESELTAMYTNVMRFSLEPPSRVVAGAPFKLRITVNQRAPRTWTLLDMMNKVQCTLAEVTVDGEVVDKHFPVYPEWVTTTVQLDEPGRHPIAVKIVLSRKHASEETPALSRVMECEVEVEPSADPGTRAVGAD